MFRSSVEDSITPHFPGGKSREEEAKAALNKVAEDARTRLRDGEEAATMDNPVNEKGADERSGGLYSSGRENASKIENGGFYKGKNLPEAITKKGKNGKGKKKVGPIVAIVLAIFGGGAAIGGVQSLLPMNLIEQATEMKDGSFTSRTARMPKMAKWIMNLENDDTKVTKKRKNLFGDDFVKYRIGVKRNKKSLGAQGINVVKEGGENVLKWKNKAGEEVTIKAKDYGKMYEENREFRNDFNRGTRGFTGRIAAWIDLSAARFFKSNSLTKNLFKNWTQKVFDAEGENTSFHDIILGRKPQGDVNANSKRLKETEVTETDADGNTTTRTTPEWEPDQTEHLRRGAADVDTKAKTRAKVKDIAKNAAESATNVVCGIATVSAVITGIKAAMMISNAQNYFMATAEASDKVKAGDGARSPIHEVASDLVAKDENGKTAMEAEGMKMMLSGGAYKPNTKDPSTLMANVEGLYESAGTSISFVIGCQVAKVAVAGVSLVANILTLGTFSIGKAIASAAASAAIALATNAAIEMVVESITTDFCVNALGVERGTCEGLGAVALQNNFKEGGGSPGSREKVAEFYDAHQVALEKEAEYDRATKSPFDINNGHTFLGSLVRKVALPVSQIGNLSGIVNTFSSLVTSSITSILPSAKAISRAEYMENQIGDCPSLESVGAVGDIYCNPLVISDMSTMGSDSIENEDDDPYNPEAIMNKIADEYGGYEMEDGKVKLDSNGVEMIKADSNLGKYILYCAERSSPLGTVDMNITSSEGNGLLTVNSGNGTFDTIANSVIGAVPVAGEIADMMDAGKTVSALPWSSGANCVARGDGESAGAEAINDLDDNGNQTNTKLADSEWNMKWYGGYVDWSEMKYYQRYVEDDRLVEGAGETERSAVVAFMNRYEEDHPLDNSFEGVLARKTGYTKEQVTVALNDMAYWDYIAKYDSSDKYPVPVKKGEKAKVEIPSDKTELPDVPETVLSTRVLYAPVRDRYSVVA